ncbi:adenylate/guanylate cyclase domain-containing protein [Mesorhizobium sp. KR9-304]|uniref:adenylate/guanylate cyclase domain-containing protein n=1 Tax=Mesorhizobium sp. KR9-304 TaxID=3156614 RepID=UPI0032B5D447
MSRPASPSSGNPSGQSSPGWAKPLRVHLSVIIVLLLVAISVPLMWLTFLEGKQSAIAAAEQQMGLLSRNTIDLYESVFRDGHAVVMLGSVLPSLEAEPPAWLDAKREFMVRALIGSPHIDGVYVGYGSGAFFQVVRAAANPRWRAAISAPEAAVFAMRVVTRAAGGPPLSAWRFLDASGRLIGEGPEREVTFDPRRRPWYRAATVADGPVSVGPYESATTRALTLTLASTMSADKAVVICADVTLETISHMLVEQAVSEHSVGYVFDGEDKLIVHSDPVVMARIIGEFSDGPARGRALAANDSEARVAEELVARLTQTSSPAADDPVLAAVRQLLAAPGDTPLDTLGRPSIEFRVGGKLWLATVAPLGAMHLLGGHRIVIAAPIADFTAASAALLKKTLAIAAALVIIGIVVALLISRRISRALVALTADANQIGNLDFQGGGLTHSWISEINSLARALASARDAIRTFAVYVPRELVRQIVASGRDAADRAQRREVTILFTDIRDFTTISEQASPEAVVDMLSVYFEAMNAVVQRHNGVIVQYLGDSIYAMWNAPTENPNHVADGCRCTLELKATIDRLNAESAGAGRPELITRFGLHTGVAVVGSVGAAERRQYTAMGDTVNVASRLEGMNKQFGTTILASAAVRDRAGNLAGVGFRPLGAASAKGRHEQIEVFEMVDVPQDV